MLPSLTMASEVSLSRFSVNKLVGPEVLTEFSLIEPSRLGMTAAASAFSRALLSSSLTLAREFDIEPDTVQHASSGGLGLKPSTALREKRQLPPITATFVRDRKSRSKSRR